MISVIIPIYNVEKTIGNILECFLKQTSQDYELLLINDCSTDSSMEIAKAYQDKFNNNVEIYSTPRNMKQGGARNLGISKAKREYVAFVDPDDLLVIDFIAKIKSQIVKSHPDIIAFDYYEVKNNQKVYKKNDIMNGPLLLAQKKKIMTRKYGWELWRQVYKKELFKGKELLFSEDLYVTDLEIGVFPYLYAKNVIKLDEALYYYIRHEEATTAFKRNDNKVNHLLTINKLRMQHFKDRGFYNEYKEEIDYIFFWHVGIISMFRAYYNFHPVNVDMIRKIEKLLGEHVPNIKGNKYFANEKLSVKVFFYMSKYTKCLLKAIILFLKKIPHNYINRMKSIKINKNNL